MAYEEWTAAGPPWRRSAPRGLSSLFPMTSASVNLLPSGASPSGSGAGRREAETPPEEANARTLITWEQLETAAEETVDIDSVVRRELDRTSDLRTSQLKELLSGSSPDPGGGQGGSLTSPASPPWARLSPAWWPRTMRPLPRAGPRLVAPTPSPVAPSPVTSPLKPSPFGESNPGAARVLGAVLDSSGGERASGAGGDVRLGEQHGHRQPHAGRSAGKCRRCHAHGRRSPHPHRLARPGRRSLFRPAGREGRLPHRMIRRAAAHHPCSAAGHVPGRSDDLLGQVPEGGQPGPGGVRSRLGR